MRQAFCQKLYLIGVMLLLAPLLVSCSSTQVHQVDLNSGNSSNTATSTVPISGTLTSNAKQMGLQSWRDAGYLGKGVRVAVLDTGMPVPDIHDRNIPLSANLRYDENYSLDDVVKNSDTSIDNANHGNDMSQVIGSSLYGAAPQAEILNGVIANTYGEANRASMIKGIQWAVNNQASVINLSFGYGALISYTGSGTSNIESQYNIIKNQVIANHVAIVHSAGNSSTSVSSLLTTQSGFADWVKTSAKSDILIVGATYDNKTLAYFSNFAGSDTDVQSRFVVAPAQSQVDTGYTIGTSGAAANVSGALAVMKSRWQSLTGSQLEQIVIDTANRSFTGYSASTFGQGIVDLQAAFSPVGKTSVPVSSTASVPISSATASLPAGFNPVTMTTAIVDSYHRDFTLTVQSPIQRYQSGLDKTSQAFVNAPTVYQQALNPELSLRFVANNAYGAADRQQQGLLFLGMASGYQQNLNNSVLGEFGLVAPLSQLASGLSLSLSATAPNLNRSQVVAQTTPAVQGFKASLHYQGLSLTPYLLLSDNQQAFGGAQTESISGLRAEFQHHGLLTGMEISRQSQPGADLVQNYRIDSGRYYAGYQTQLNQQIHLGLIGFVQQDRANIQYYHPLSVGDGSLYYVKDSLSSQRALTGVSAALAWPHFQAAVLSSNLDNQIFLGYKHVFND